MSATLIFILGLLRTLVEVAGYFLLAQGLLYVLAGAGRERNPIYQLFKVITGPAISLTRALTPRVIIDRHMPFVAFFLMFWLWIGLAWLRRALCAAEGLVC